MSVNGIIDKLGPESKSTLLNLAINPKDLSGSLDFSNSISKDNAVTVEILNGNPITKIRISNNVKIYKNDFKTIPLLLEVVDQSDIKGDSINLDSFSYDIQSKIGLCFMQEYGYIRNINGILYFTENIKTLFNTEWWLELFNLATISTHEYIDEEVSLGNQPIKNKELIIDSGYFSVEKFKDIQPETGMDILWALVIYFFDKIIRNWEEQSLPEIIETDTIMDIDIDPGKYIKQLDAKTFFVNQLKIYLQLRPNDIFFGGSYFSRLKDYIHKKATSINKTIILEEMVYFTDWMNILFSGSNNMLNSENDSGTEPFTIRDVVYSESENGPTTNIILSVIIQINSYQDTAIYTLPITTKIN